MSTTTTPPASVVLTAAHRSSRVAASAGFGAQGFVLATILTSLTTFKDRFGLGDLTIALVVLGVCAAAGLGTVVADRVARTAGGSRAVLGSGLVVVAVAVVLVAVAPTFALLAAGFAVYGVALGMVDAGTNMQAVAIQRDYGRSLLTGFYAAWSAGGVAGTVLVAVSADRVPSEPVVLVLLPGVLVAGAAAVLAVRGARRSDVMVVATTTGTAPAVPWGPLLLLGLAVAAYYVNDQAVSTWSPIFMDEVLHATGTVARLGYAGYLAMTLVSRVLGDPCVRCWGRVRVVRVAALVGVAGLVLVLTSHSAPQAIAGFAVAGAGLGLVVPLCFSAAESLAPGHADAVVARLNGFNYLGAVLGGVFVGAVGSASDLRWGFAIPAALVAAVAVLAGRFGVLRPRSGGAA